jgi:amphiphysin
MPSTKPLSSPDFRRPDYLAPTDFTTATILGQTPSATPGSDRSRGDYFGAAPQHGSAAVSPGLNGLAKKRPPPPPPAKRIPSTKQEEFVVAQYDFSGQGGDDLSFREGDRIKIVKKTNTDQDWWVGELGGIRGNFPANYCKAI